MLIHLVGFGKAPKAVREASPEVWMVDECAEYSYHSSWKVQAIGVFLDRGGNDAKASDYLKLASKNVLSAGGLLVLFVDRGASDNPFLTWTQETLGLRLSTVPGLHLEAADPRFNDYFANNLAHQHSMEEPAGAVTIAHPAESTWADHTGFSFVCPFDRGSWAFAPLSSQVRVPEALRFVRALLADDGEGYPDYLNEIEIGDEASLREERARLPDRLAELDAALHEIEEAKSIMWRSGVPLEAAVVEFLTKHLGIDATQIGGADEDFRLLGSGDPERDYWAIGEVKGHVKNVTRTDVMRAAAHRSDSDDDASVPVFLVVNTFASTEDVAKRDRPVEPNVIKIASEANVLVVRTLDLMRLHLVGDAEARSSAITGLRDAISSGDGGWVEADDALELHHRTGEA